MKFCQNCGNELFDEAVMCPKCGQAQEPIATTSVSTGQANAAVSPTAKAKQKKVRKPMSPKAKKILKRIVIAACALLVTALLAICAYQVVCAQYINRNLDTWISTVQNFEVDSEKYHDSLFKVDPDKFNNIAPFEKITEALCDDYDTYEKLLLEYSYMYSIKVCYTTYEKNYFDSTDESLSKACRNLFGFRYSGCVRATDNDWATDALLAQYAEKLWEMCPTTNDLVLRISQNKADISITVENKSVFPIYEAEYKYFFDLMFVSNSYSSSISYGSGSEDVLFEDIPSHGTQTVSFKINPQTYYKDYGTYSYWWLEDDDLVCTSINYQSYTE